MKPRMSVIGSTETFEMCKELFPEFDVFLAEQPRDDRKASIEDFFE